MSRPPIIRVGRWQDNLPESYDPATTVVITDPPYGLQSGTDKRVRPDLDQFGHGWTHTAKGYDDVIPWSAHVREVLELLPAKRHVIRGPATALIGRDHPQPRRVCVEMAAYRRRAANRPGVVPYLWQGWAVYGRLQIERHKDPPKGDALTSAFLLQREMIFTHPRKTAHRAITPFASCAWIIDTWADPGDLILDPFAGMGTIGRAAQMYGFDYLGSELDPEFAAVAAESFDNEPIPLGLAL